MQVCESFQTPDYRLQRMLVKNYVRKKNCMSDKPYEKIVLVDEDWACSITADLFPRFRKQLNKIDGLALVSFK